MRGNVNYWRLLFLMTVILSVIRLLKRCQLWLIVQLYSCLAMNQSWLFTGCGCLICESVSVADWLFVVRRRAWRGSGLVVNCPIDIVWRVLVTDWRLSTSTTVTPASTSVRESTTWRWCPSGDPCICLLSVSSSCVSFCIIRTDEVSDFRLVLRLTTASHSQEALLWQRDRTTRLSV